MIPCCFLSAALVLIFQAVHNLAGLVVMSVLYGLISGGMVSLPPAIIANLTRDPSEYGVKMGVGYTIAAFGALIGNPIAGAARGARGHTISEVQREFQGSWIFAGSVMMVCTGLLVFVQLYRKRKGLGVEC